MAWLGATVLGLAGSRPAHADEYDPFDDVDRVGAYEVWAGVDAAATTWLAYSGITVAPFGDTHSDGFRLRSVSGVGQYRYEYSRDKSGKIALEVNKATADLLLGYQASFDNLTAKGFLGWSLLAREFATKGSLDLRATKLDQGVKFATELWLDWSEASWASLDLSYAAARQTIDARLRIGQRLENVVSAGPELVFHRTDLSGEVIETAGRSALGNLRLGVFARYDWFGGEVSASAGVSTDITKATDAVEFERSVSPYGTFTVLFQF